MAKVAEEIRCAKFTVSYYVKLEPISDLANNVAFRTGMLILETKKDESWTEFDDLTNGSNPGGLALRITDEIESMLRDAGHPRGHVCVINFWKDGENYWDRREKSADEK